MRKILLTILFVFAYLLLGPLDVVAQQPVRNPGPAATGTPTPPSPTPTISNTIGPLTGPQPSPAPRAGTSTPTPTPTPGPGAPILLPRGPEGAIDFGQLIGASGVKPELNSLGSIVSAFVPYLFGIAGIALLLYLLWGGLGIMLAQGDPKATAAAKERITKALVGFVIIFVAFWLVQILGLVLGIKQFGSLFQ